MYMEVFDVKMYYDIFVVIGAFVVIGFWLTLRLLRDILNHIHDFIVYYIYFEQEKAKGK